MDGPAAQCVPLPACTWPWATHGGLLLLPFPPPPIHDLGYTLMALLLLLLLPAPPPHTPM